MDVKTNAIAEASDWSSPSYSSHRGKRPRNNDYALSGYPSHGGKRPSNDDYDLSAKFKGVVAHPNGHWGAQIYANHQRVWLGTFKSEIDAAMAYDSASIKLRNGDSHRNFPCTNITVHELKFQGLHETGAILNMIRDGSYLSKFSDYLRSLRGEHELGVNLIRVHGQGGYSCKLLFQKELTPSDVGKLNRLVVPKKYAVQFFPPITENTEENTDGGRVDEVHLFFYDKLMKLWKFRYCYWKSSQSFVFTRGWNRFVKEKGLKANHFITFYICEGQEKEKEGQSFYVIDVGRNGVSTNMARVDEGIDQNVDSNIDLSLRLGQIFNRELIKEEKEEFDEQKVLMGLKPTPNGKKRVRLFGADIN